MYKIIQMKWTGVNPRRIKRGAERHDERNPDKLTNDIKMIGDVTNGMESKCAFDSVTGCVRIVVAQRDTKNPRLAHEKINKSSSQESIRLQQQPWHLWDAETRDNNVFCMILPNFIPK